MLHIASQMGHFSLVNYLLLNGANINQRDAIRRTPISTSLVAFNSTQPPLTSTTLHNRSEIVKLLVKFGSSLDLADAQNQTPLILAVATTNVPVACVSLLISSGCDIDHIDSMGNTALTYAIITSSSPSSSSNRSDSLIDLLLKHNAATHILDQHGRSVLSIACSLGAESVVGKLMQRGLDEMHRDNAGWTPLHEAAHNGHLRVAEMLLDYGGGSELLDAGDNDGRTSLHVACQRGHIDIVRLLVHKGANLEAKSHEGITPLRMACLSSHVDIARYLVERGAHVDARDADGRTTLMVFLSAAATAIVPIVVDNVTDSNLIHVKYNLKFFI